MTRPVTQPAVIPHLIVGDTHAAIAFYKAAFDAQELGKVSTPDDKVLHAAVSINGATVFLNDDFPEFCGGKASTPTALGGNSVTVHLYVADADEAWQKAVAAGAEVVMPLDDQFWGDRYGIVKDLDGHQWSIAHKLREVSPEDAAKAAAEMFASQG